MTNVWRVQSKVDGRGPYRPGLTMRWADPEGPELPDILTEFGRIWIREIPNGWHAGCGFLALPTLMRWFSGTERVRLATLGFQVVRMRADLIVRRGALQVIFARRSPLTRGVTVVPWSELLLRETAP